MKRIAIYAGTFDPITKGHLDIIKRAAKLFDKIIVAVSESKHKNPIFTREERVDMIKNSIKEINNVSVDSYSGLLMNYLKKKGINTVIRGIRVISDFEHEFQFALLNKKIYKNIDFIYLMPDEKYLYISSSSVKEIASYSGNVKDFVNNYVENKLKLKFKKNLTT